VGGIPGKGKMIKQAASLLADYMTGRAEYQWAMADVLYQASLHPQGLQTILTELETQHGLTLNLQTARNYARVAGAFSEEHRHYHLKWSNYLEWSNHEDPIEAMETALDNCYSPSQMRNLRLHGDPKHKRTDRCKACGGDLRHCMHGGAEHGLPVADKDDETETS